MKGNLLHLTVPTVTDHHDGLSPQGPMKAIQGRTGPFYRDIGHI